MAKATRTTKTPAKPTKPAAAAPKAKAAAPKAPATRMAEPSLAGWANELVFNVREPKVAVSLRLDADVLRFFRGFGSGYQTRINEVLKAFMSARAESAPPAGKGSGKRSGKPN